MCKFSFRRNGGSRSYLSPCGTPPFLLDPVWWGGGGGGGGRCCQQTVRPLAALLKLPDLLALISSGISHCTPDRLYITVQSQRDRLHVKRQATCTQRAVTVLGGDSQRVVVKRQATCTQCAVTVLEGGSQRVAVKRQATCKETGYMYSACCHSAGRGQSESSCKETGYM